MAPLAVSEQFNHTIRLGCIKLIEKTSMATTRVSLCAHSQKERRGGKADDMEVERKYSHIIFSY